MKTCWDLSHLYKSNQEWNDDYICLKERIEELKKLSKNYICDIKSFHNFFLQKTDVYLLIEKLYCYARRHLDLDSTLEDYQVMFDKVLKIYGEYQTLDNKFENDIIENASIIEEYLKDQRIANNKRYFKQIIRRKEHIPSVSESDNSYSNYSKTIHSIKKEYQDLFNTEVKFDDVFIDGEKKELTRTNYNNLILSSNQNDRKNVFDTYTKVYEDASDKIAGLYISKLLNDIEIAKLEHYDSLLEKKLFELELPLEILDNLISEINNNLDVMHRYMKLKKRVSGLNEYHMYDTSLSVCEIPKLEIEFEEALKIIKKALGVLGNDYAAIIDKMFNEGWIDVYPKENKRTMSFTCISYVGVPYILINYNKTIDSVRTLGHEIGHGIHTYYSKENNDFINFEFSLFLTEIVSKVNELLVFEYMLQNSRNIEEEKYILNSIISNLGNSLFGQIMLTEFEHTIINKLNLETELNADVLNNIYFEINKKYNGEAVTYDDNVKYGWAKIPHFIMQDTYYLYQYSIGMALATNIAYKILTNDQEFIKKYREFLVLGNSVSIDEALNHIDIDLRNGNHIEEAVCVLKKKLAVMEKLCK